MSKAGMVWQAWRGAARLVAAPHVPAWRGRQGEVWQGVLGLGPACCGVAGVEGQGLAWCGSVGLGRPGTVRFVSAGLVVARRGPAGEAWRGRSRRGESWYGSARQAGQGLARHVVAWLGAARLSQCPNADNASTQPQQNSCVSNYSGVVSNLVALCRG